MATQWVLNKVSDALAPTVSNAVSGAGSFAGGAVNAVGSSINGVGEGINNSIRRYGDGVKDYGNGIMDWTQAGAGRATTAANPLGLGSTATGGKRQVTSPQIYRATPKSSSKVMTTTSKNAAPQKKIQGAPTKNGVTASRPATKRIEGGTPQKALPAAGAKTDQFKKAASSVPAKKVSANPGAMRRTDKPPAAKKVTPVKPSTASAPKTSTRPKVSGNPTGAANPLGLNF